MYGYTFFDTELGRCAIAWGDRGIAAVELPAADDAATHRRLRRALPDVREAAPPPAVEAAIDAIVRLFDGEPDDLSSVVLDMEDVPEFHRRVYDVARTIAPGETLSYGEVAARLGEPGAAQAVGRAVAADGALHGFSAPGGIETKRRMLAIEGTGAPTLFD